MAKLPCFQFALLTGVPSVNRRIFGPLRYPFGLVAYQSSFVAHPIPTSNQSYYRFDLNGYSLCRGLSILKYKMCSRRISRVIRMLSAPLALDGRLYMTCATPWGCYFIILEGSFSAVSAPLIARNGAFEDFQ